MNALVLATHDVDLRAHDRVVRTNAVGLVNLARMAETNAGDVVTNRPLNSERVRRILRWNVRKRVMNPRSELRQNLNNAL